ncbi:MAG TPA: HD domain-containing protein [Sphingobacteriaceae bacterium]|nr:HD domain-containing protein [Sphingobacteriaceae bacterium]
MQPTRQEAWEILNEYTKSPNLIKHALAVEACMRYYARKFGEDEEKWGITGLIHDFDYEQYPDLEDHPFKGVAILRERGWPEDILQAVLGHGNHTGVPRDTLMAKTLFAVDELSGLVVAVALVRQSKSIHDVKVSSVKKKLKDKAFARGVNRDDVYQGVEELGIPLDEHIANVIAALKEVAADLELDGR